MTDLNCLYNKNTLDKAGLTSELQMVIEFRSKVCQLCDKGRAGSRGRGARVLGHNTYGDPIF